MQHISVRRLQVEEPSPTGTADLQELQVCECTCLSRWLQPKLITAPADELFKVLCGGNKLHPKLANWIKWIEKAEGLESLIVETQAKCLQNA